jgi:hypothetical protein
VRGAQLLNGLPDVGLAVEPGAADPGGARDELAALSGGAQMRAIVSRHGH